MQIDEEYFNNEEFKQKLRLFEDSVKSGHPIYLDDDDLTDIIDYYNLMNEGGKAMQTADFALSLYPSAPGPITYKIRRCIDANDISRAEELLEKVTDKEIDYKFLKAEILLSQEQPGLACHLLDEAIEAAEEDDRDNCVIDAIYLFMDYAYYELASKWLKRINNTRTEEYADLEIKVLGLLGEIDKVIEILNRLIDKNPFQHKYWNMISFAQLTNGNYNEALDSSDYSLAITPGNPGGLMCKAQALMKRFYFDEAVKYLYEYLKTYENDVNCLMQIGYCLMNMSKNDKALDIYLKAETKSSCDSEFIGSIYENIALAYSHTGNFEKAMEYIDKIEANCEDAESKHIKLLRGYAMLEAGRYKEGLFLLTDLLVKADYDPADTLKVSVVLFENHCEKAAYTLMRDNFPLDDDTMVFGFAYYALYCLEVGEEEEYLKYLKIAVERNSDEAFMTLHHLFPEGMTPEEYYDYAIKRQTTIKSHMNLSSLLGNLNYGTILLLMLIESTVIPFPSEVVVAPAAYHAAAGYQNVFLVVLFATIGADLGAAINYAAAYYLGRPIIYSFVRSKWGKLCLINEEKVQKSEKYFDDHGVVATLTGRLLPVIRQLISVPAGLAKMNFWKFLLYTTIGAGIWNAVLAALGWYLHSIVPESQLEDKINEYSEYIKIVILVVFVIIVGYFAIRAVLKKKESKHHEPLKQIM